MDAIAYRQYAKKAFLICKKFRSAMEGMLMTEIIENQEVSQQTDEIGFFGKDAKKSKSDIGARIIATREAMKMTQKAFASFCGMPLPSLKDYEAGKRMPGGESLQHFIDAGINANWLLTGEGPMLLGEKPHETALNAPRLTMAVEAVEEGLRSAKRTMPPTAKAELVATVYQALSEDDGPHRLLKLVKDILARSS